MDRTSLQMKDRQIERCLESDESSNSESSDSEIELSLLKEQYKKKLLSKKLSNTEDSGNSVINYGRRNKQKVDNDIRSDDEARDLKPSKPGIKKCEGTPTRKRKAQNDDYKVKRLKSVTRNSLSIKMKFELELKSGSSNWKIIENEKISSPKSKNDATSNSDSPGEIQLDESKTPTKLSAKKNLFSPERSSESTSHQQSAHFTRKKNLFSPERSPESTSHQRSAHLTRTPKKEQQNVNSGNHQESMSTFKDNINLSTPKKNVGRDFSSNDTYELINTTPNKNKEEGKCLNGIKIKHSDARMLNECSPTKQNQIYLSPQKLTRSASKQTVVDNELYRISSDKHNLKTRTPLKEIESSPLRSSLRKCSIDSKSVQENSPFKKASKLSNVGSPATPKRSRSANISKSDTDYCCLNIVSQELSENKTTTPRKEVISSKLSQETSDHKSTAPRKKVVRLKLRHESSPSKQNILTPQKLLRSASKQTAVDELNGNSEKQNLTNITPLKEVEESPRKEINCSNIFKSEKQSKHIDFEIVTPNKRKNDILHQETTDHMSPSICRENQVQLKDIASPLKNKEITVTTPVTKKKDGKGFLTPSMAKRDHEANDKADDALDVTRKQLHISTVPKSLPCRDAEFSQIKSFLIRKIEHSSGGCMYISGVPGTGKTATVHAVVRALQEDVSLGELPEFDFVEVNGLRLTEPRQSYVRIYQALTNQKLTPDQAQQLLNKRFSGTCKKSTIILVDELDYLCNRRQDVVYNILDWPTKRSSALVVLTISNTMDLPERTLKGRVTSRMGLTRLTFQPYSHHQLKEIVLDRLSGSTTFHPDAVQLVARKVAAVSGDARRALDICRRTTELIHRSREQVTVTHVEEALVQLCAGARVQVIRALSGLGQLVLRSVRDVCQRTGVDETTAASVYQHLRQIVVLEGSPIPPTGAVLQSCVTLVGLGLLVAEKGRADLTRKMSLNVSSDDIHYALDNVKT